MNMTEIIQGTDEWFELRRGLATGSHFAEVMAQGKGGAESTTRRNYRMRLALEIVTGKLQDAGFKGNSHTERGNEREPFARMSYESLTGNIVTEVPFIKHKYLECGVSPDGLVGDDGMTEFKCPIPAIHWEYMGLPAGVPPSEYVHQIMGQLWVSGRKWCDFVSYCEEMPESLQTHITRIYRDEQFISNLEAGVSKFLLDVKKTVAEIKERASQKAKENVGGQE